MTINGDRFNCYDDRGNEIRRENSHVSQTYNILASY